jgi:hypothetical protein
MHVDAIIMHAFALFTLITIMINTIRRRRDVTMMNRLILSLCHTIIIIINDDHLLCAHDAQVQCMYRHAGGTDAFPVIKNVASSFILHCLYDLYDDDDAHVVIPRPFHVYV